MIDRTYRYVILNQEYPSTYLLGNVLHFSDQINITKIKSTFKHIKGEKDYSCFRSSGCSAKSPIKNIKSIKIAKENNFIYLDITANSFLYHMVRNIVGTIVDVWSNKILPSELRNIINKKDRKFCSKMAPSNGLFLWKVSYTSKYKINYNSESILL